MNLFIASSIEDEILSVKKGCRVDVRVLVGVEVGEQLEKVQ
jgi:hypothetical protein